MKTILGKELKDKREYEAQCAIEADVIVTAVVLGFIGTRWHLGQPCRFDVEHPSPKDYVKWHDTDVSQRKMEPLKEKEFLDEYQQFLNVMSALSYVLDQKDPAMGACLEDSQSPEWSPGALITGRAGGQMADFDNRHKEMQGRLSKYYTSMVADNPVLAEVYLGKGAYTGVIDDPVNDGIMIQPTKRVIDAAKNRWHPGADYVNWGLIRGAGDLADINLRPLSKGGLGPLPGDVAAPNRIGYIHGMSSAINKCVSSGSWCTPYELATGEVTTKMASCFACTTYMYASGFPPSSSHLGRGESWVPPTSHLVSGEKLNEEMPADYENSITQSLAARWHWDIYHYLCLGSSFLYRTKEVDYQEHEQSKVGSYLIEKTVGEYVNLKHTDSVIALSAALDQLEQAHAKRTADIGGAGANLFLDALTVHDSDWKRVGRTIRQGD